MRKRLTMSAVGLTLLLASSGAFAVPTPISPPLAYPGTGLSSHWVQVTPAFKPDTIAEALATLALGPGDPGFVQAFDLEVDVINFGGNAPVPQFAGTPPVVNNPVDAASGPGTDPLFAVEYSGYLNLTSGGTIRFAAAHDDGVRVTLGGEIIIDFPVNTPPVGTASAFFNLAPGLYTLSYVSWEQGGQFLNQFVWQRPGQALELVPESALHPVPEPATLSLIGIGSLALGLARRRRRG